MDLSKLSTEDLLAIQAGDMSNVSTEGLQLLRRQLEPAAPVKKSTVGSELVRGAEQLFSSTRTGLGQFGTGEEAAQSGIAGIERAKQIAQEAGEGPSLEAVKQAYADRGLFGGAGEALSQIPRAVAGQGANIAAMGGAAAIGSRALGGARAGAVLGPWGAAIGGALGAATALLPQFMGANIERQVQEQQDAGVPDNQIQVDRGAALSAAMGQSLAEGAGGAITIGRRALGGILGKDLMKAGGEQAEKKLLDIANRSLTRTVAGGVARGAAAEIPVELAQQIMERAQAGLSLTDEDAQNEYGDTIYQTFIAMAPVGGAGAAYTRAGAKTQVKAQEAEQARLAQEEARVAAAEAEATAQAEREARAAEPGYIPGLIQQFDTEKTALSDLYKQLKAKGLSEEQRDALKIQIDEQKDKLKEVQQEYGQQKERIDEYLNSPEYFDSLVQQRSAFDEQIAQLKEQSTAPGIDPASKKALAQQLAGITKQRNLIEKEMVARPEQLAQFDAAKRAAMPKPATFQELRDQERTLSQALEEATTAGDTATIAQAAEQHKEVLKQLNAHPQTQYEQLQAKFDAEKAKEAPKAATIARLATQIEGLKKKGADEAIYRERMDAEQAAENEQATELQRKAAEQAYAQTGAMYQPGIAGVEQGFQGPAAKEAPSATEEVAYAQLVREKENIDSTVADYENSIAEAARTGNVAAIADLSPKADAARAAQERIGKQVEAHPEYVLIDIQKKIDDKMAALARAGEKGDFASIAKITKQIEALQAKQQEAQAGIEQVVKEDTGQMEMWGAAEDLQTGRKLPTEAAQRPYTDYEKFVKGVYQEQGRQERIARNTAYRDLIAQQNKEAPKTEDQLLAEVFYKEQGEQALTPKEAKAADEAKAVLSKLLGINVRGELPSTEYSRRVLGRPTTPMSFNRAEERVENALQTYEEVMDELVGGYYLGGKNEKLAGPMNINLVQRSELIQQAEEAKNAAMDALLAKADNVRLDKGLPRLDDEAAMQLMSELNTVFIKHTSGGGIAPQLPGRLSQTVKRYAKPSDEEKARAVKVAQREEAAGFALKPQTEEQLAEKVAAEEGAGKTNRIDTVSALLQQALDTKPTGAIRTVLEEAKRIVDTDKAPKSLMDEAEAQALRIINGKTPQMRNLYDETVIAKEGRVTEEKQRHFPQFAQRGTIRATPEKFQKFLSLPRTTFLREEYIRTKKAYADMLEEIRGLMDVGFKKEYAVLDAKLSKLLDKLKRGNDIEQETKELIDLHLKENPDYKRAVRAAKKARKEWEGTVDILRGRYAEETARAQELKAIETNWHSTLDSELKKKYPRNAYGLGEAYDAKVITRAEYRRAKAAIEEAEGIDAYLHEISSLQAEARKAYDDAQNTVDRYLREATQAAEGSKFIKGLKAEMQKLPAKIAKQEAALKAFVAKVPSAMEGQAAFVQERARREEELAKERAALRNAQKAQAVIDAAVKEVRETALKAKREDEKKVAELTASLPTTVVRTSEERISAGDIRQLKKERTQVIKDKKQAEDGLTKFPKDKEFRADFDKAKERLTQINKQLAEWQRKGAQVRGQPVGATYYSKTIETKEGMSAETRAEIEREQRKEATESGREAYAKKQKLLAEGRSTSVVGLRNEIEKLNARLAEKNAAGKNVVTGAARTTMRSRVTSLDRKLAKLLEADRTLLSKARYEKAPGNIIKPVEVVPSKKIEGTNLAVMEEEAAAERAAEMREDEDVVADREFAQATLLRDSGTKPAQAVDAGKAQASMDKVGSKLNSAGIKFKYYPTLESLPAKLKKVLANKGTEGAKGMILPDGTVVVIGDMHNSMRDLEETVAHEVVGHYGVEGAIGEQGIERLSKQLHAKPGEINKIAAALGVTEDVVGAQEAAKAMGLSEKEAQMLVTRELIAHTAEAKARGEGAVEMVKSWIKTLINAVRTWLKTVGMDDMSKATTKEIQQLVNSAFKQYVRNELPAYRGANGKVHFRWNKPAYATGYDASAIALEQKLIGRQKDWTDNVRGVATGLYAETKFVDMRAPIEKMAKELQKQGGAQEMLGMQTMYHVRSHDARMLAIGEAATNGPPKLVKEVTKDGHETWVRQASGAPGLKAITQRAAEAKGIGDANTTLRQFGLYLVAKRALRVGVEKALGFDLSAAELAQYKQQFKNLLDLHKDNKAFQDAASMYAEYNKALMDFLAQSGYISQETANSLTKHGDYVGFYRQGDKLVDGSGTVTIGDISKQKYLQELVGGKEQIVDFQTSSLQNTALIMELALRNTATKNTAYMMQSLSYAKVRSAKKGSPAGPNIVRFKQKGDDMYAVIDSDAAGIPTDLFMMAMEGAPITLPTGVRLLQGPASMLRTWVTRMPLYAVRQIMRDSLASTIVSGSDARPITSALKQVASIMKGTNKTERVLQEGGFLGGQQFSGSIADMKKIMNDVAGGRTMWSRAKAAMDNLAMAADASARVTAYNSYIEQGMSNMEAQLAALEVMNFTKRGASSTAAFASMMIPFFNAQVQGLNVLAKAARGTSLFEKKLDIRAKMYKRGLTLAGLTVLYAAAMQDDEAYKNATEDEKLMYWFVRLPGLEEPVRVPIPFEIGYIFKSAPEALVNLAFGDAKAKDVLKAFGTATINTIPGGSNWGLPQAIKPLFEIGTNHNIFTGRSIESKRFENVEPGMRYDVNTSALAKTIGGVLNVSPIKLDHLVRGYFGSAGTMIAASVDPLLNDANAPERAERKLSELPFIGPAFQPNDGRGMINSAYDTAEAITQAQGTYKKLIDDGKYEKAMAYAEANADLLAMASFAGSFKQRMGELAKQKRAIENMGADVMDAATKRELIDQIKQAQIAMAKILFSSTE